MLYPTMSVSFQSLIAPSRVVLRGTTELYLIVTAEADSLDTLTRTQTLREIGWSLKFLS